MITRTGRKSAGQCAKEQYISRFHWVNVSKCLCDHFRVGELSVRTAIWCQDIVDDILQFKCISTEHTMQVSKWGNSLAVRLPATVVDALGLKEGDQIEIQIAAKHTFAVAKAPGARELLARLRKFRGRLPATFKFDRLEANERR